MWQKNIREEHMNKKVKSIICLMAVMCLSLCGMLLFNGYAVNAKAETVKTVDTVVYKQDFSTELVDGDFGFGQMVTNGVLNLSPGLYTYKIPAEKLLASNNYEVSFDIKAKASGSNLYIHLEGLDGSAADKNIFLEAIADGQYWRLSNYDGQDIYNNSGFDQGGVNDAPVPITEVVNIKMVHFDGYIEVWLNGERRIVTHLSNFGNTRYMSRKAIPEGTITGIWMDLRGEFEVDNLVIKEALPAQTSMTITSNTTDHNNYQKITELSAVNLYKPNFKVSATWVIDDETKSGYYPMYHLYGINNYNTIHQSNNNNGLSIQGRMDGAIFTPEICWWRDKDDGTISGGDVSGKAGTPVDLSATKTLTYEVEVYGDVVDLYVNGVYNFSTSFTEMGITKGHLQNIDIQNGGGGAYWTSLTYEGFDTESAATIRADKTLISTTEDVVFTSSIFGNRALATNMKWYVNGVMQEETTQTLTLSNLAEGEYTVVYKNDTLSSEEVTINVVAKKIVIEADKTEMYPIDTATFTAQTTGDFAGETIYWYVNGEQQLETGLTLTLSDLAVGEYLVTYKTETVSSNEITLVVKQGKITINALGSYLNTEKPEIYAELVGIKADVVNWYINNTLVEGAQTTSLVLDLSTFALGETIAVRAEVGDVVSNEKQISIAYDVLKQVEGKEFYQEVSQLQLDSTQNYGSFKIGEDQTGKYLYTETPQYCGWAMTGITYPTSISYVFSYELFVPADITNEFYCYPCFEGFFSNGSGAKAAEVAVAVNADNLRLYLKNQSNGKDYDTNSYGFGKDLSYNGLAKKGDWNAITVAVDNKNVAMYLNGELVLFLVVNEATVPTGYSLNFFPSDGTSVVPLRLRNITFSGIVPPAPDLESVTLSVSSVKIKVGESVILNATLNPFDAEAETIEWFVNDSKVDGTQLKYTLTPESAGTYKVYCVVNGIKSAQKTVTVEEQSQTPPTTDEEKPSQGGCSGCQSPTGGIMEMITLAGVAIIFMIRRR